MKIPKAMTKTVEQNSYQMNSTIGKTGGRGFCRATVVAMFVASLLLVFGSSRFAAGQEQLEKQYIAPIEGSRVFVGRGEVPNCVLDGFLYLCEDATPIVVVVALDGNPKVSAKRWKERGAHLVEVIDAIPSSNDTLVLQMLKADGVWFEGGVGRMKDHKLFPALLRNVMGRGGVVGVAGEDAVQLVGQPGFDLLPNSVVHLDRSGEKQAGKLASGMVHWEVPEETGVFIHRGRRVSALGNNSPTVKVLASNDWPERSATINAIDAFDPGDVPAYDLDWLSWQRSAIERSSPVFPAKTGASNPSLVNGVAPALESGTLVLHGGSGVNDETFERFIDAAGGKNALIVCLPSASHFDPGQEPNSYSASRLRDLGCENVSILHTSDPRVADKSERFLAGLRRAKGVWIDGGRTFRFMDCYESTEAHQLLRDVLKRGGVVGGSSAGCQVAGDFLVRGNPKTNQQLVYEGYTKGLQLLQGVVMDAHFRQRGRGEKFVPLMKRYPQLLGIGVDEKTALLVRGSVGEVIGENGVTFYDMRPGGLGEPLLLEDGEKFDLVKRKKSR